MSGLLRWVLLGDGPSDRVLRPIVEWSLIQAGPDFEYTFGAFIPRRGKSLVDCVRTAREEHAPDILVVHRDAEAQDPAMRTREVLDADKTATPLVPVRMTEAWLLIDEQAIRRAADNPSGTLPLGLPPLGRIETLADPKQRLQEAMLDAADVQGRRRERFKRDYAQRLERLAVLLREAYPRLRSLNRFVTFEEQLRLTLARIASQRGGP